MLLPVLEDTISEKPKIKSKLDKISFKVYSMVLLSSGYSMSMLEYYEVLKLLESSLYKCIELKLFVVRHI